MGSITHVPIFEIYTFVQLHIGTHFVQKYETMTKYTHWNASKIYQLFSLLGGPPIGNSPGGYMAGLGVKCEEWYQHAPPVKYEQHFLPFLGNNTKVTIPD